MEREEHSGASGRTALRGHLKGLSGQACLAWRQSYGQTGTLHFGEWVEKHVVRPKTVYREQGSWVVGLSDCDRHFTGPDGELIEDLGASEGLLERLSILEGATTTRVELGDDLALSLQFDNDSRLLLAIDSASEDEQWGLRTPAGRWATVYRDGRWTLEG